MKSTKKVIITGTSRGIGYELVKLFSKAGYKVLALSRNSKPISELNDPNVTSLSFNLNNSSDFVLVNDFIKKEWGNVDVLINNAGSLINKPFLETSAEVSKKGLLISDPALFIKTSTLPHSFLMKSLTKTKSLELFKLKEREVTLGSFNSEIGLLFLERAKTLYPAFENNLTNSYPIPRLVPVMMTFFVDFINTNIVKL